MADLVTIYAPSGRRMRVERRKYERIYKPSGWRTSKPTKTSGSSTDGSTKEGDQPESKG